MASELDRLQEARSAYAALQPQVAAGEPWPLASVFGTEPEAAWGPREVLAHVAEMLPFWLGELERVVDGTLGGPPVPFGRTADDAMRIGYLHRDRTLPLRVLFRRIDVGLGEWAERLPSLTEEQRGRLGLHARLGELAAGAILERFVLGHAEEHVAQLEAILENAAAGSA
jgi:hypothetical protein